jgi:peptide deformylase
MPVRKILLLGDPRLYEISSVVTPNEIDSVRSISDDLRDTLIDFRTRHGYGRAIAAPQIAVLKRIIYLQIDEPVVIINPELTDLSDKMYELWDDCLSFPGLRVKVRRHLSGTLTFSDPDGKKHRWSLKGDLSELIQHEYDHLEGILATQRAVDPRSLDLRHEA